MTATDNPIAWITEATKPTVDYWTAKHLICRILELIPDSELDHLDFDRTANDDGSVTLGNDDTDDYFTIGYAGPDGRPVITDRVHAAEAAIKLEVVHRADVALWLDRMESKTPEAVVRDRILDEMNQALAEDVIAGRVIHNVETDTIVLVEDATDEQRAEAAAAYKRLISLMREEV